MDKTDNPLLAACAELFFLIAQLRHSEAMPDDFRQHVMGCFAKFEQDAQSQQMPSEDIDQAKYALMALIDEVILHANFSCRAEWMQQTLQMEFHGEHLAGEHFFKHLAQCRLNATKHIQVIEVFYVCLQLGFRGGYRHKDAALLNTFKAELYSQIELIRGAASATALAGGLCQKNSVSEVIRTIPIKMIAAAACMALLLIYVIYIAAIHATSTHVRRVITQQVRLI